MALAVVAVEIMPEFVGAFARHSAINSDCSVFSKIPADCRNIICKFIGFDFKTGMVPCGIARPQLSREQLLADHPYIKPYIESAGKFYFAVSGDYLIINMNDHILVFCRGAVTHNVTYMSMFGPDACFMLDNDIIMLNKHSDAYAINYKTAEIRKMVGIVHTLRGFGEVVICRLACGLVIFKLGASSYLWNPITGCTCIVREELEVVDNCRFVAVQ